MEKLVMDVVNAGIALFRSGEEKLKTAVVDLEKVYNDLKSKGELDKSPDAQKIRDLLNKTIADAQGAIGKTNASYDEIVAKLQANYQTIYAQIDTALPPQVKEKLKQGLDELKALIDKVKTK
ncbi:phasin-related domain-containing protein [Leptospira sp. 'Mane']|uniref:phasin-related domain-containing protein n=1 Tax=Leptospira sp. 'Mane' TaxID=3387407 RepID=UPI00398B0690